MKEQISRIGIKVLLGDLYGPVYESYCWQRYLG